MSTASFEIEVNWAAVDDPSSREAAGTYAHLEIRAANAVLTRCFDDRSKTVRDDVLVSAYPLALWIVSSWWRLLGETSPDRIGGSRTADWRMSHEMPAAGWGFVWPRITFEADHEGVEVRSRATTPGPVEPVQYLGALPQRVSQKSLERGLADFVEVVLARLEALEITQTDLHTAWTELTGQRTDPRARTLALIEAALGFDPGEAAEGLLNRYLEAGRQYGQSALSELAAALGQSGRPEQLDSILQLASSPGLEGRVDSLVLQQRFEVHHAELPWERGWNLARALRTSIDLDGQPATDRVLFGLLGLNPDLLPESFGRPIGLAVRQGEDSTAYLFHKGNPIGRRFEAARFLCDLVLAPQGESWLPVTDARTARQMAQRAFAAEFLCPFESLNELLNGDYSEAKREEAAAYFGVSELAIDHHLENHRVLN